MWVRSDQHMLEQMLRNLVSNAVRYTDHGKILMGCRRAGKTIRIEIWDSGVGIAGEEQSRIFEEYFQTRETAHLGGFGLGLAIVRRLGAILGHRIDVRSTPGEGSMFSVDVPLAQASARPSRRPEVEPSLAAACSVGRVLIIEDEGTVRAALEALLRSAGITSLSAATGHEALALVADRENFPDVIVSDYNLPGKMDGVESIVALRRALARDVPAIILTGETRSTMVETIARHDISVAIKPLKPIELLNFIRQADQAVGA
jgi:CheY-like chemotaxis protein